MPKRTYAECVEQAARILAAAFLRIEAEEAAAAEERDAA